MTQATRPTPALVAVVLAAGAATRMGESKAALVWAGASFLQHCVRGAAAVVLKDEAIFVVEGAHPLNELIWTPGSVPDDSPAISQLHHLVHPGWRDGPLSSLQCALQHPRARGKSCLVLTVDRPHVSRRTLHALVQATRRSPDRILQPRYQGRNGHPIIWPADLCARLLQLAPTSTPRELLVERKVSTRRAFVEVDDRAVIDNIDDPEALAALRALTMG